MTTFRSSGLGNLLTGFKNYTAQERLTELQHKSYLHLCEKEINGTLTSADEKKLDNFLSKITDKNKLKVTAHNFIFQTWLKKERSFEENVTSKEMQKGIEAEDESLMLLSDVTSRVLLKNQKHFKKGLITGTPDCLHEDVVIDVKTSWSPYTFMKAEMTSIYEWQLRAYMYLTGQKKAELAYCLVDMPELQFSDIERRAFWQNGIIDTASEEAIAITEQLKNNYIYSSNKDYTKNERVKIYTIEHCTEKEELMLEAVELALEFYKTLTLNYKPDVL